MKSIKSNAFEVAVKKNSSPSANVAASFINESARMFRERDKLLGEGRELEAPF